MVIFIGIIAHCHINHFKTRCLNHLQIGRKKVESIFGCFPWGIFFLIHQGLLNNTIKLDWRQWRLIATGQKDLNRAYYCGI